MNRLFITGDTHGLLDFNKLKLFCSSNKLSRDDYIIVAGDCGVVWSKELLKEHIASFEKLGVTILFIDGNHENFDMLNAYSITQFLGGKVHKISDNIYHLLRGEIFSICGKTILALGGGESNDINTRQEGKTWWSAERITKQEYDNAIMNLSKNNNVVDIVVSHMPPTKLLPIIEDELTCCGEELPWYIVPKLIPRISNDYLQEISEKITFKRWFFGHIHIDTTIDNFTAVYERVLELK